MIQSQQPAGTRTAPSFLQSSLARLMLHPPDQHADHNVLRQGTRLGLVVAVVTWIWVALVDAVSGAAFSTPRALGGIVAFTVVHCVLNVVYAVSLVSLIQGAARQPSLILAALVGFVMVEIGFLMTTAVLSYFLGGSAWVSLFGGSLIGAAIAFRLLALTYPLGALLRQAEVER